MEQLATSRLHVAQDHVQGAGMLHASWHRWYYAVHSALAPLCGKKDDGTASRASVTAASRVSFHQEVSSRGSQRSAKPFTAASAHSCHSPQQAV